MGKVLLITGTTGIAEATALRAAQQGDSVFVISRDESHCLDLAARLPVSGYYACDLRDERGVEQALTACINRFGGVDAVFNVAGISGRKFGDGPLHECTTEGWDVTLDTNVKTMFLVCRGVLRYWLDAGRPGAILNMSSVLAYSPQAQHFATHAYAASKGAIISMSRAMAAYYAPHKIRVNVIAPALVPLHERPRAVGCRAPRIHLTQATVERRHARCQRCGGNGAVSAGRTVTPYYRTGGRRRWRLDGERIGS